jgi:hypothetical protein
MILLSLCESPVFAIEFIELIDRPLVMKKLPSRGRLGSGGETVQGLYFLWLV